MADWVSSFMEQQPQLARLPVAQRARYGLHLRRAGRGRLARLSGAPVHYFDAASRSWQEIDTRLQARPDGGLGAPGLPFHLSLDGGVAVEGRAGGEPLHRHKAWRVGAWAGGRFAELARLGSGAVEGERLVRTAGAFQHVITLLPGGLREELVIAELPPASGQEDLLVVESLLPRGGFAEGWLHEAGREGLHFPAGWAQDASGRRLPLMRWVQAVEGAQRLYSGVPFAWLAEADFPVVLDPDIDITGHTADGWIQGSNAATSDAQNAAGIDITVGGRNISGAPHVWRGYLKFDTSSLGIGAEVEQANLKLYIFSLQNHVGWTMYLRQYNWSANDPFSSATREAAWDGLFAAGNTAVIASSANQAGTFVTSPDLPTGWVDVQGNTYYGLWCSQEAYAYPNNQGGLHQYASANHGTAAWRPLLMLEYMAGYPRSGPLSLRARLLPPRLRLADTRQKLRARARRTALHARVSRG
ncbi:MAG: hypothetical protein KIS85_08430 [Anaerolineales bacterium]|nr:hypothetical protein [Anaerolineales bacterium]